MNRPESSSPQSSVEAGVLEARVEVGVALAHLVVERDLELVHDPVGQRGEDQVRLLGRDAGLHGLLRVEGAEPDLHQRLRAHDVRRRALDHRHVGAVLPQGGADVVRRVVRADHDCLLAARRRRAPGARSSGAGRPRICPAPGCSGTFGLADMPVAITSCLGRSVCSVAVALDRHDPFPGVLVVARALGLGGAPVVELHHPRVHLEPVGDLVLGGEHRPVVGEPDVRQVVVPDRVVQAERLVAVAPGVAGARVALDDDRRARRAGAAARRGRCRPVRRRR